MNDFTVGRVPVAKDVRIVKIERPGSLPTFVIYYIEFGVWVRSPKTFTRLEPAQKQAAVTKKLLDSISKVEVFGLDHSDNIVKIEERKK